jgi:hypothetical protein
MLMVERSELDTVGAPRPLLFLKQLPFELVQPDGQLLPLPKSQYSMNVPCEVE